MPFLHNIHKDVFTIFRHVRSLSDVYDFIQITIFTSHCQHKMVKIVRPYIEIVGV